MMKLKKGNIIVTYPLVLLVSIFSIVVVGVFFINAIFPFIWYQKLNITAQKYMFVIERFGYLTNKEKNNMINDLKNQGFDSSKINIVAPNKRKTYGELIEFKITYDYSYKNIGVANINFNNKEKNIKMKVYKNSYSKI